MNTRIDTTMRLLTNVCNISFLLGLLEASTTLFPDSFVMAGIFRAWLSICFSGMITQVSVEGVERIWWDGFPATDHVTFRLTLEHS